MRLAYDLGRDVVYLWGAPLVIMGLTQGGDFTLCLPSLDIERGVYRFSTCQILGYLAKTFTAKRQGG